MTIALLTVVGMVLGAAGGLWINDLGTPSADARTRQGDAVWLGHAWVDGRKGPADVDALVKQIGAGVHDLFVHTGPLRDDGTLDPALYPKASWLVTELHQADPGIRVQAWLGDVVDSEGPGLDLSRTDRIIGSFRQALDAGFDGIHIDFEPVHSGDRDFLTVLEQAHLLTTERDAVLSVSVPQIEPVPGIHLVGAVLTGHPKWWTSGYLSDVADRVDQVAVMAYDSGLPLRSLFSGYIQQQTRLALQSVPNSVDLLIGLPAYHDDNAVHHASAETVAAAIRGVRLADHGRLKFGVAMYADFAATASDWAAYYRGWVDPQP
ncbi:hypothetical protein [Streptacidiphilus carbonis]|uniref:hypothetical protein n=1 Tax=Streptacidiphilus carbonis TaxID=105422 RepID=UPI0009FC992B|nr:hypothetical protein [Streptacidiphilus carbonis]